MKHEPIEKLVSGLLVWNKAKAAEYLNLSEDNLTELVRQNVIIPDVITPYKFKRVMWFQKLTLDVYIMQRLEAD